MTQLTIVPAAEPPPVETPRLHGPDRAPENRPVGRVSDPSANPLAHSSGRRPGSRGTLHEGLARELDVPVEAFFTDAARDADAPGTALDADASELLALVRHWLAIGDGQARRRVLSLARQEAERAGFRVCA